ncbi:hypothetical protein CHS0354_029389 [Potamilus streckersoni]|nr:hypothetical protein CHS0354_029389 [Potamilus streckersoni]
MADVLSQELWKYTESCIGPDAKSFSLIYDSKRDGCDLKSFHIRCDNKGPTVTIFIRETTRIIGYTSNSWQSVPKEKFVYDNEAFLIWVSNENGNKPLLYRVSDPDNATRMNTDYGPSFGKQEINAKPASSWKCTGGNNDLYWNIDMKWQSKMPTFRSEQAGNYPADFKGEVNVQVYLVTASTLERQHWRRMDWSVERLQKLKREVEQFLPVPGQIQVQRINILLLGQISAGKSSFVNTVDSIFSGCASNKAESANSENSVTKKYRQYKMRSSDGKELAFRLCDTRGIEDGHYLRNGEIQQMLDGRKQDDQSSEPSSASRITYVRDLISALYGWMKGRIKSTPTIDYNEKVYCAVYVLDSSSIETLPTTTETNLKECRKIMKQRGIPEVVLLTKADQCCREVDKHLKDICYSPAIKRAVQSVENKFSFNKKSIYPVVNMENEVEAGIEISILALMALKQMLFASRTYIYDMIARNEIKIELSEVSPLQQNESNSSCFINMPEGSMNHE